MNLLLDTHTLIWFINGDKSLPDKSIDSIKNINNNCFVSIASVWEIGIKLSLKKLDLNKNFDEISTFMFKFDINLMQITFEHINKLINLEFHHRDPFDRIIISQGIVEKLTVITKDEIFKNYGVKTMWY